ncbi:hypothetical protein RyT2_05990 [Pseudolactococcus yaeyamensis]
MSTNSSEFVVYQNKLKQFGLAILSLLMVFMSLILFMGILIQGQFLLSSIPLIALSFLVMLLIIFLSSCLKVKN